VETGQQWNGVDLYASIMCSPYGDGVELAIFVDEDCTMYTNQATFESTYNPYYNNDNGVNYIYYAENYIKNAFSKTLPCMETQYDNPEDGDDDNADEDEEEEYQVNEYCGDIFGDDVADFNNCYGDEARGDDDNNNNDDYYNWYEFNMYADDAEDIAEVCYVVNSMQGEYYHAYDEEGSGTWYVRDRSGGIQNADASEKGLTGGAIALIVILSVAVVAAAAFFLIPKKKGDKNQPLYQGGAML